MKKNDINLSKVNRLICLAFLNSTRLHNASIELYNSTHYGYAHFLSVIALEELGKAYCISDFLWNSKFNGRYNRFDDEKLTKELGTNDYEEVVLRRIFSNHKHKQMTLLLNSKNTTDIYFYWSNMYLKKTNPKMKGKKISNIVRDIVSGKFETKKQDSIYVGLPKTNKGRMCKQDRIINPLRFSSLKTKKQISLTHNELISQIISMLVEEDFLDSINLEKVVNLIFLEDLIKRWNYINARNKKLLLKYFPQINP